MGILIECIFTIHLSYVYNINVNNYISQSFSMTALECIATFILSYLMLDVIHRTFFLPCFFPMAIFGAPVHSDNHAKDAYNAALDMRKALVELNKEFEKEGKPTIRFGIGIHSGKVLAGNIGATNRMEYTVIGDTVNTASRIESLCKEYKTDLLITESTKNKLEEKGKNLNLVADATIRGKEETVKLYN